MFGRMTQVPQNNHPDSSLIGIHPPLFVNNIIASTFTGKLVSPKTSLVLADFKSQRRQYLFNTDLLDGTL
jgi:hypothetical protein